MANTTRWSLPSRLSSSSSFSLSEDDDEEKTKEITPIQATSLLVSFWRWKESQRGKILKEEDGTADGILLNSLLTPEQLATLERDRGGMQKGIDAVALRTRFIDEWAVQRQHQETGAGDSSRAARKVVVNLGAGMDARPYRLMSSPCRDASSTDVPDLWIEVDSDVTLLNMKHQALTNGGMKPPMCNVRQVGADVSHTEVTVDALAGSLSQNKDESMTTTTQIDWIAEGLLAYLEPEFHEPLLKMTYDMSKRYAASSRMVLTFLEVHGASNFEGMGMKIPWKRLAKVDDIVTKAKRVGWRKVQVIQFAELYQRYCYQDGSFTRPIHDLTGYVLVTLES